MKDTFAQELHKARIRAGFRFAAGFADAVGLEPHTYRKYERGDCRPNFEVLVRICDKMGITPNDLLTCLKRYYIVTDTVGRPLVE